MKNYWLSAACVIGLFAILEVQPPGNAQPAAAEPAPLQWGPGLKVLIAGGGFGHDWDTWDNKFDTALLQKAGITSVHYTEDPIVAANELPHVDVLLMSANYRHFDPPAFRLALSNYVDAGKGLVLLHSGTYYAWAWADYYSNFVGAFAPGHDGASEFDVTVLKDHPVTHGLPTTFKITDELYHVQPWPAGSPMEILAESSRPGGEKYPSVWLVHDKQSRTVCISLGHDGFPRRSPEFSMLVTNAVKWAGGQ
jgi:trehalose utilization protein